MEEAASYPEAALRFMTAIGYEEYVPAVERLGINLTMLTAMPMIDLERKLGVTPKKAAVALFDATSVFHTHGHALVAGVRARAR